MFSSDLLPIYLNDHFAGATAGLELARRAAKSNGDTEFGEFLNDLARQIETDRAQLEEVMARLEVTANPVKVGAFWLGEKLGRLKLNGRLLSYSPLSRVVEIEGLISGVNGKRALWQALAAAAAAEARLAGIDFEQLIARADEQHAGLERHHALAIESMLAAV